MIFYSIQQNFPKLWQITIHKPVMQKIKKKNNEVNLRFSLLLLHIGICGCQFPSFWHITELDPSLWKPSLHENEAIVLIVYPPFSKDVLYSTSPCSIPSKGQVTTSLKGPQVGIL